MKDAIVLFGDNNQYPWKIGELVTIQEIENFHGHCIVYKHGETMKMYHGYHTDNFYILTDNHYEVSKNSNCEFELRDFLKYNKDNKTFYLEEEYVDILANEEDEGRIVKKIYKKMYEK